MSQQPYNCPFKFRAWDGRRMVMVQTLAFNEGGSLWYGAGNQFGWAWINPECTSWTVDNPKPSEGDICPVMRWTGLRDKNGVEIWEGDVLSWCDGEETLDIQYVEEYARFGGLIVLQDGQEVENVAFRWFDDYGMPNRAEVIGNIYQNPELLKS